MSLGYSYANGFSAGISYGFGTNGTGLQLGLEYSENNGYGASIGYGFDDSDFGGKLNGLSLKYGESQRGGKTYSASLGGKNVPATLNYSLNVNGGVRTNTFGVSIQLPGTDDFSNVVAGINYNDHSGFSSDVSYTFGKSKDSRTPEQRKADAARYNLLDEIFSGVGAMIGGIGRGVKSVWDGMFGPKPVFMGLIMEGMSGEGSSGNGVSQRGGSHEDINNFEFDETRYNYEVVDENGKTISLEEYRAGLEKKVRDKLTSDPNYKGDLEKDTKRILKEASQVFMSGIDTEWSKVNQKTGTETSSILGGIRTDYIEVDGSGNAHYQTPKESIPEGYSRFH